MEKKYRDICIVLIFSVCSVLVLSGLIITNYFMNGRLLAKVDCACTKCGVKDSESGSADGTVIESAVAHPKISIVDGNIYDANTRFERIVPTSIEINGNKVEYPFQDAVMNVVVLDDVVLADVDHVNYSTLEVIDFNGNVIATFAGANTPTSTYKLVGDMFRGKYRVEGNDIIIGSDNLGVNSNYFVCKALERDASEEIQFEQKITYLGNGKFSEFTTVSTLTASEYQSQDNTDCSWLSE